MRRRIATKSLLSNRCSIRKVSGNRNATELVVAAGK